VRRGQRQCKRGMLRSAGQDDTGEQMNLPCRREAEPHAPGPATKFGFQILASCGSIKEGKRLTVKQKTFLQHFLRPRSHFVGVHLFDFRFVGYTHRRRKLDDFRFQFGLRFAFRDE